MLVVYAECMNISYQVKLSYDMVNYCAQSVIPGRSCRLSPGMTLSAIIYRIIPTLSIITNLSYLYVTKMFKKYDFIQ